MNKPHYADIARHLTEGITSGHFPVGSLLPTELALCEHYGTSRHTVRAALLELQKLGLVSRRKNVGTRVESSQPVSTFRPTLASVDDLLQFGEAHVRVVQQIGAATLSGALARELSCADGSQWLRISSLRLDGDAGSLPIGWTDVYVDPAYADIGDLVRESPSLLISSLIESRYGRRIAEIRQDIQATAVPAEIAEALQIQAGAPALRIVRQYLDADELAFEMSVTVHPAERFSVSMRLQRSVAA